MSGLTEASALLESFRAGSLRMAVAKLENSFAGLTKAEARSQLGQVGVSMDLLLAALLVKRHAGQINEIIHAIGILLSLPHILEDGEVVEGLSLAAGNTGKQFDLETNRRVKANCFSSYSFSIIGRFLTYSFTSNRFIHSTYSPTISFLAWSAASCVITLNILLWDEPI